MRKTWLVIVLLGYSVIGLVGCVVRTYPVTKDRLDQDLTVGNRGYLRGELPTIQERKEKKSTRTVQAIEIELHSPIKFEAMPKKQSVEKTALEHTEDRELWGNRGYITESYTPEIQGVAAVRAPLNIEKYTVQKGDTLQKISQKFYGTTKKWNTIYQANKDILSGPNKIYPGQVLNIPVEPLKETPENLK